jgi:aspartate/methionine/tyrosine aminotransferase
MGGTVAAGPDRAIRTNQLMDNVGQAVSIKYNNLVYELKAAGQDIITLSLGEAFFDIPQPNFDDLSAAGIHHYSHSRGVPELRHRLAKYYENLLGVGVDPEHELLITAGSKAAIFMVLLATIEPGDEVVVLEPFWLSYPEQVRLCGGRPVMVPHSTPIAELDRYLTARTRAIIVNNPNNPSGHVFTAAELRSLHDIAHRNNILLLADETYNEFVTSEHEFVACGTLDPDKRHTVVVNSMSKNYGISGWRIGYVIAHKQLVDQVLKINQHVITCAPTILSCYLAEHFDELIEHTRPQIQRTVRIRNKMAGLLADRGIDVLPGSSTFYLFASLGDSTLTSTEFANRLLRESSVSVVPGIAYGASCDHHIRISVGAEPEDRTTYGIDAVKRLIDQTAHRAG